MSKTTFIAEPGKQEVTITREFDAPMALVYKTMRDPEAIPKWWGPSMLTTTVDRYEPRQGGVWRFVQRDAGGEEFGFHGVFHSVSPEYTVSTFEWEGMPGHVLLEAMTLEERNGKTLMTTKTVYQSMEDRDGMVASGMEYGATESMDRLAELVSSLQQQNN